MYFIKSGKVKVVRDLAFFPFSKYDNAKSNQIFKDDPLDVLLNPLEHVYQNTKGLDDSSL